MFLQTPILIMYQQYFGLREMPFNITPDPRFLFLSPTHQEALEHLRYGVAEKKGFIVLTGEVGCGKTTICRQLLDELEGQEVETALILNPRLSETELVQAILHELRVEPVKGSHQDLLDQLNRHLLHLIGQGKEILLVIDESQNMTIEGLEHLRLLSNLETNTQKLLQILLIGQPELKEKLRRPELRQLRQRILVFYDLKPLSFEQIAHYIRHRLALAGANGKPWFTPRALHRIHRQSGGVPRLVNNLCDKSLLAAFVRSRDHVDWWDVRKAAREMDIR
jgi:general secretion pathway protein A